MKTLSTSEARKHFSDIVNLVAFGKERQIVSRRGKELVAVIPIEELRWLEKLAKLGSASRKKIAKKIESLVSNPRPNLKTRILCDYASHCEF